MKPQAFLDWSGNWGFKFAGGSSTHLVFALIVCDHYTQLREAVRQFKRQRNLSDDFELHYTLSSRKLRATFFDWLPAQLSQLQIVVLAVNKLQLSDDLRRMNDLTSTSYFVQQTIALLPTIPEKTRLFIDGERAHTDLQRRIRVGLSQAGYYFDQVQLRHSRLEVGIQVADMLAGTVMDTLQGNPRFFNAVRRWVIYREFEIKPRQ